MTEIPKAGLVQRKLKAGNHRSKEIVLEPVLQTDVRNPSIHRISIKFLTAPGMGQGGVALRGF